MRRPDCLKYPSCLADAAVANAGDLPCYSCPRYQMTDSLWLYHHELPGLLRLWLALEDEPDPPMPTLDRPTGAVNSPLAVK